MRIGAYVQNAAPEHAAGAEWALHDLLTWMAMRKHECTVLARGGYRPPQLIDGVAIRSRATQTDVAELFLQSDVVFTQLEATMDAQLAAMTYQTPLVHYIHSPNQLQHNGVMPSCSAAAIANSEDVYALSGWWPGRMLVVHPPVDPARVAAPVRGACCTLVNLSHNKGAVGFIRLAERVPEALFMGVQGAYGDQVVGPEGFPGTREYPVPTGLPANVRCFGPFERIAEVFGYTRTLLVLSQHESYGKVAAEAITSGIPVISTRTPGLEEALGSDWPLFINDRDDHAVLDDLVRRSYTPEWDEWSLLATKRSLQNQKRGAGELRALELALQAITKADLRMTL